MKRQHLPLYALAAAIVVVGLAFTGVPISSLLIIGLVILVCPLMMMFMMGGMHGGHGGGSGRDNSGSDDRDHDHRPTAGHP